MNKEMKCMEVDVHNDLMSPQELVPYLLEPWRSRVASSGIGLPGHGYCSPVRGVRKDCIPPSGGASASDTDSFVAH
ncbi:hypothetical protein D3C73_454500 [compost metagenome]